MPEHTHKLPSITLGDLKYMDKKDRIFVFNMHENLKNHYEKKGVEWSKELRERVGLKDAVRNALFPAGRGANAVKILKNEPKTAGSTRKSKSRAKKTRRRHK